MRLRLAILLCAVLAVLAVTMGAESADLGAATTCKKLEEKEGCKLSKDFDYSGGNPRVWAAWETSQSFTINVAKDDNAVCTGGSKGGQQYPIRGITLFKGRRPIVGHTYKFDGPNPNGKSTLEARLKFKTATKANVEYEYHDKNGRGSPVICEIKRKHKLTRTQ